MTVVSGVERFSLRTAGGPISAEWTGLEGARAALVLGHGAGAGMGHPFMRGVAERLAARGVATLRYQFPYTEAGRRRPDPPPLLHDAVRAALQTGAGSGLPLFAGGKSLGGRMTSQLVAADGAGKARGLVFLGFPLHPAGRPGTERAAHLDAVQVPMLFLQGDRDKLAELALLQPVVQRLGARATMHVIPQADHGFHVPARSGRNDAEVLDELAEVAAGWILGG